MNSFKLTMVIVLLTSVLISFTSHAGSLVGQWKGNLEIGQQSVPIIFNVSQVTDKLTATMDSPLQGAKDIPVESVEMSGKLVAFNIAVAGARYEASFESGELIGTWNQSGQSFSLRMKQSANTIVKKDNNAVVKKKLKRPQEPKGKLPYKEKEVRFTNNKSGIELAGTLTIPANPIASVVLITGSGPQERNQLFMGHKTFLVLADYLTRQNIAVLRYDDRGVGQSQGKFDGATSYDFAEDASSAVEFLKAQPELNSRSVGIIGHSEGGLIAPIVAKQNTSVDFITLLAGPSRSGQFVSENQMKKILESNGISRETAIKGSQITKSLNETVIQYIDLPKDELKQKLKTVYQIKWQQLDAVSQKELQKIGGGSLTESRLDMLVGNWYKVFLTHQPVDYLTKLNIPTLAIYGDKDVQISAEDHVGLMEQTLMKIGISSSKVVVLPNHNHMFQRSKTGAMTEYQHIEETLSPMTLSTVANWINNLEKYQIIK